jgi:hypothetical protein
MSGWANVNTATLLTNGKILFVGNAENDGSAADAEVYDPRAGTFTRIGNTAAGHEFSTAVLLPDGKVLIAGGQLPGGDGDFASEPYAPETGTFAFARNMITARHEHTATLLADGTVLIAGGFSSWPLPTSSAELYKPPVLQAGPALLSLSGDGRGQGAILHAGTSQVASSSKPAAIGEALEIYCTGLIASSVIPPQVAIGGRVAEILFFGLAPGFPGLNQVNVRVPSGVAPGPAIPVRLTRVCPKRERLPSNVSIRSDPAVPIPPPPTLTRRITPDRVLASIAHKIGSVQQRRTQTSQNRTSRAFGGTSTGRALRGPPT